MKTCMKFDSIDDAIEEVNLSEIKNVEPTRVLWAVSLFLPLNKDKFEYLKSGKFSAPDVLSADSFPSETAAKNALTAQNIKVECDFTPFLAEYLAESHVDRSIDSPSAFVQTKNE